MTLPEGGFDSQYFDRTKNPAAYESINLLGIIATQDGPISTAAIFEQRNGGIYPNRTAEELELLTRLGLLHAHGEVADGARHASSYTLSNLGRMQLSLEDVRSPIEVSSRLDATLADILKNPPVLPAEKYGNEEFRFTWESVRNLMELILRANSYIQPRILALGTPTIAYFAARCPDLVKCHLLDINEDIVTDVNDKAGGEVVASHYDAREPAPPSLHGKFDAVIVDPPWHNEHYYLFADRGYDLLRNYGRAFIATFAPATRPEAVSELAALYQRLMVGGFDIIEITPEFFGYQIPRFEAESFAAQGIHITSRGNYGQLLVVQKSPDRTETCSDEESLQKINEEMVYSVQSGEEDIGDLYLAEDLEDDTGEDLHIEPYNDGKTYETTSRSARRHEKVNFITRNDHVAFRISNPARFLEIARRLNQSEQQEVVDYLVEARNLSQEVATEQVAKVEAFLKGEYSTTVTEEQSE